MNLKRLKLAEANFLQLYPEGFGDPEMVKIRKKHPVDRLSEQAQVLLAESAFVLQGQVIDDIVKLVSRSSMVSMFEKPKFREFAAGLSKTDRERLAAGFREMLHGDQERGFEAVLDLLIDARLAKWSLISILPLHMHPQHDVFVKPTTAKGIVRLFELDHLEYRPRPSWAFYEGFRTAINDMKSKVHPSLSPNNAAFTGFLMMTLQGN